MIFHRNSIIFPEGGQIAIHSQPSTINWVWCNSSQRGLWLEGMNKAKAHIDVWSDYVCPFCYLAEPTLTRVTQQFGDAVAVNWRAFELRPDPIPTLDPKGD